MNESSTVVFERPTPKIATITFSNPPANVVLAETAVRLYEIVRELETEPEIQVVVFRSDVPDFFVNHFDLAAIDDLPAPDGENALPIWTDLVLRLPKAPYITIASIR
ncbi:hypothetical protein [Frankia sp. Cas3]|uniref:hypothetical protein n=1 Tax=Frankia sp. Cas3 TaxID=3073926 RepID=UPI002AD23752|nr:hypothetical protein [Frankia sp. Cas3]